MDKLNIVIENLKKHEKLIKIGAVIIIFIAALFFFTEKGEEDTIQITGEKNQSIVENSVDENVDGKLDIYVDVSGCVKKPGVYQLNKGARIYEAIEKAGGLTNKADTANINQAEIITDGMKINIPEIASISGNTDEMAAEHTQSSSGSSTSSSGLINLNTADSTTLQEIPGVGPSTADKIISYRTSNGNFKSIEDIKNVSGIGDKTFEKLKNKITV